MTRGAVRTADGVAAAADAGVTDTTAPPPTTSIAARLRRASRWLAAVVGLSAATVLVGWVIDSPALKSAVPGLKTMKANNAADLLLLAVALASLGLRFGRARRRRSATLGRGVAFACLAGVVTIAGMTLAQYAFGVDLGVDNLLFVDRESPRFPGRMSPATAAAQLLLAVAYGLLLARRAVVAAQLLLIGVAVAPLAGLAAYLYGAPGVFDRAPYPTIALHTAVGLMLLCVGGLFARAGSGMMGVVTSPTPAGAVARKLLPAAGGVPLLTGLLVAIGERTGVYTSTFGSALLVGCCGVFFAGAVCWTVALLWRAEGDRERAETARATAERDRHASERKVGEGEQRLRIAIGTAGLGTWQSELATGEIECSARHLAILGLPADGPLTQEALLAAVHPDDRDRLVETMGRALADHADHHAEYRVVWPDGSVRWVLGSGRAIYGDDGKPARLVGVTLDVTARREADDGRERLLAAEREARSAAEAAKAAAESARAESEQARAESERANRMKDEFVATVSHELRTPLNAILGWAAVLRESDAADDRVQAVETIDRNARAQVRIIEDLLDMGRIVSGKVRLAVGRVDLPFVIEAAFESMRPAADAKGVRLQKVLDPDAGPVSGDPDRMQQVVWNLLGNAIKFTPRGGRVRVTLARVASHVEVAVADTGEGIRPAFLPHLFERFRQADASTTRRHGGLGLGLAIVKNLVELHGGTIVAESAGEKQGATFRVALPLLPLQVASPRQEAMLDGRIWTVRQIARPAAAVDAVTVSATSPDAVSSTAAVRVPSLAGVRVLVVDDEPDSRRLVQRMLEDRDATATIAGSVAEAVDQFQAHARFDVIVSDIGMPDRDGYDLIRTVRGLPGDRGGRTPAIALTAYAHSDDRARAMLAGFDVHVAKPVNPGELCAVVARLARRAD